MTAITQQRPIDRARGYIHSMVMNEARTTCETERALHRISRDWGLSFWTIDNIRRGRAKTIEAGLFEKIRAAYLNHCEWKLKSLAHEIRLEKASGDDLDQDLLAEAEALIEEIRTRRVRQ